MQLCVSQMVTRSPHRDGGCWMTNRFLFCVVCLFYFLDSGTRKGGGRFKLNCCGPERVPRSSIRTCVCVWGGGDGGCVFREGCIVFVFLFISGFYMLNFWCILFSKYESVILFSLVTVNWRSLRGREMGSECFIGLADVMDCNGPG